MWLRAELKTNAKRVLSRYYWAAVLVCFLYNLIASIGGNYTTFNYVKNQDLYVGNSAVTELIHRMEPIITVVMVILFFVSVVAGFLVINPLIVGMHRFFMESRSFKSDFSVLFYGFTKGRYLKNVKVMALMDIKTLLWSLLLIVPGIIKSYEYYMIPYILAENSDLDTNRYFELSKSMTDGEKINIFTLGLSFLGWALLGVLSCGLGMAFISPYIYATYAELYALMRAKAFALNFSDTGELRDFLPPVVPGFGK